MKNYAAEERNKTSIIDHIEADIVSVLNEDGLGKLGGAGGVGEVKAQAALQDSIKTFIFFLENWYVLSRDRVRKFGTPILKGITGSTRTKTNQSAKYNLSVENLRSEVPIARKQGSAWPSRCCRLINGKRIGEAILSEMENGIIIITDHIKYLEAQQVRNMNASSDKSLIWSKPANTNLWEIDEP